MPRATTYIWSDKPDLAATPQNVNKTPLPADVLAVKESLLRKEPMDGASVWMGYLDVLGFAQEVARAPTQLFEKYKAVRAQLIRRAQSFSIIEESRGGESTETAVRSAMNRINAVVFFSDSLFIFGADDSREAHDQICEFSRLAFRTFFQEGLPSKGAIEVGPVWADFERSIFLGAGINRAHRLCESLDHIGVVANPVEWKAPYLSDPMPIPSKVGGPVRMCVPRYLFRSGLGERDFDWRPEWSKMISGVRGSLHLSALGKYEASEDIVATMMDHDYRLVGSES